MKIKILQICNQWLKGIIELVVFIPVIFAVGIYLIHPDRFWLWIGSLPLLFLAGILLCNILGQRLKSLVFLIGIVISGLTAFEVTGWNINLIPIWGIGIFLICRCIYFFKFKEFPPAFFWIGLMIYLVSYVFFKNIPELKPYLPIITCGCLISICITLFSTNMAQLKFAALPKDNTPKIPFTILRHNRIFVSIIFIIICLIAGYGQLQKFISLLLKGLFGYVFKIIIFLLNVFSQETTNQEVPGIGEPYLFRLPPAEGKHPIWDYIFHIAGIALAIAVGTAFFCLLVILVYKAVRKLIQSIRKFLQIYRENMSSKYNSGYVDERESLLKPGDLTKNLTGRIKEWLAGMLERESEWGNMGDNKERVRYLYRRLLLNCIAAGYNFKNYFTPRETGIDLMQRDKKNTRQIRTLMELYNKARYGDKNIEDDELESVFIKNKPV